ncbi:MAG: hypothetical protein JWP02_688, partial [Acidimicrobiales bacterium]|nr:hypothetical protein [Acidimicrobiales bacterium]
FPPATERLAAMERCGRLLLERGLAVWTSGRSAASEHVAVDLGVPHNVWNVDPATVAAAAQRLTVTWAGPPVDDVAGQLADLEAAGATWAIYAPPPSADWPGVVEMVSGAAGARR